MSVDIHDDPRDPTAASDADGASDAVDPALRPRSSRRRTALEHVAGAIPDGGQVEQSLDQFIAQVHSSLGQVSGWSQTEEQAAREREEAARLEEDARRSALAEAEAAALAAEAARRAAESDATRARDRERRASQRMVALEARLADAEQRAAEAEKRARRAPALPHLRTVRMRSMRPLVPMFVSSAVVGAAAVAVILFWRGGLGRGDDPAGPPAGKAIAPPRAHAPLDELPEPVVRSMLPAEPTVTPLEDRRPEQRPARPLRRNPGPDAHVRPQHQRATPIDRTTIDSRARPK